MGDLVLPTDTGLYSEGVSCPYCDAVVITGFESQEAPGDSEPSFEPPCAHVFLLAHDVGITYLSEAARLALSEAGITITGEQDLLTLQGSEDDKSIWDLLGEAIQWPGAQVLAVYAPAPSLLGAYAGVAP